MKGDFSRNTFDPVNHFSRVLMQQGRVQLDADWNEQASILLHYLQTLAADLIGPYGGPQADAGFEIFGDSALKSDFLIGPGRLYVDGILCEFDAGVLRIDKFTGDTSQTLTVSSIELDNSRLAADDWIEIKDRTGWHAVIISKVESNSNTNTFTVTLPTNLPQLDEPVQLRRLMTFGKQPDYPKAQLGGKGTFLVYLDVWERHLTAIEDGHIREVALGGPDTATRAKVVWQVKVTADHPTNSGAIDATTTTCRSISGEWPTGCLCGETNLPANSKLVSIQTKSNPTRARSRQLQLIAARRISSIVLRFTRAAAKLNLIQNFH